MVHATPRFAETASFDDTFHHMFLFPMDGYWGSGRYYNLTLYTSWTGCSKLTTSLVNVSLKFQT